MIGSSPRLRFQKVNDGMQPLDDWKEGGDRCSVECIAYVSRN